MIAIIFVMGTKYDCNDDRNMNAILKGPNMNAILIKKGPNMIEMIENLFTRDLFKNHSHVTLGQFSTLQSYLVTIGKDCNHIWSDSELRLQSY